MGRSSVATEAFDHSGDTRPGASAERAGGSPRPREEAAVDSPNSTLSEPLNLEPEEMNGEVLRQPGFSLCNRHLLRDRLYALERREQESATSVRLNQDAVALRVQLLLAGDRLKGLENVDFIEEVGELTSRDRQKPWIFGGGRDRVHDDLVSKCGPLGFCCPDAPTELSAFTDRDEGRGLTTKALRECRGWFHHLTNLDIGLHRRSRQAERGVLEIYLFKNFRTL